MGLNYVHFLVVSCWSCTVSLAVSNARKVFEKMSENVFSWISMMGMYNVLGCYEEIVNLFYLMIDEGVRPDHFVFSRVYKACSELRSIA